MPPEQEFKFTVHCYNDKKLRKHFASQKEAVRYANSLLAQGYKIKIFPYSPPKKYIDYLAESDSRR